jgi:hypothetical protein
VSPDHPQWSDEDPAVQRRVQADLVSVAHLGQVRTRAIQVDVGLGRLRVFGLGVFAQQDQRWSRRTVSP